MVPPRRPVYAIHLHGAFGVCYEDYDGRQRSTLPWAPKQSNGSGSSREEPVILEAWRPELAKALSYKEYTLSHSENPYLDPPMYLY